MTVRWQVTRFQSHNLSRDMTKPTKWVSTQRRLRSAWASAQSDQFSLSAWRNLGSLATHWAHSEDSDQTGWMPRLIWVFAGRTSVCWFCHEVAHMWHFRNMLNGDFPAWLWLTPILTNLNGNMEGGGDTSMAQDAYHHSWTPGFILGFRGFKSSPNFRFMFLFGFWNILCSLV